MGHREPGSRVSFPTALLGVIDLVALALVGGSLVLLRSVRRLPHDTSPESIAYGKAMGRHFRTRFRLVFSLEVVIVAAVDIILHLVHHAEWFFPLLAIIVGLHFLPLAQAFRIHGYYVTGVMLCLAGLIVLVATPSTALMGRARVWDTLPGLLSGAILWPTAISVLLQGRNALSQVKMSLQV